MDGVDRLRAAVAAIVRSVLPRAQYLGYFPATVLRDNGDMTLDLEPDDPALPQMVKVPLRTGIPGLKCEVQASSRVLVAFEGGGDLAKPAAHLWETSSLKTLTIEASSEVTVKGPKIVVDGGEVVLAGGTKGVVLDGDAVTVTTTCPAGAGTGTGTVTSSAAKTKAG